MKAAFIALSAIAFASTAAAQQPPRVEAWLGEAREQITQAVEAKAPVPGTVRVQFRVGADRRLSGAHVVESSGSRDLDEAVVAAVKRSRPAKPPVDLLGRRVTLAITADAPRLAAAPAAPVN